MKEGIERIKVLDAIDNAQNMEANIEMDENDVKNVKEMFPPNTKTVKTEKVEPKKVEKVVTGLVRQKKKSFFKKVMDTLVSDDASNISGYIIHDILVPAFKDVVEDMVKGSIEVLIRGERTGSRTTRDRGVSRVSYNSVSSRRNDRDRDRRDDRRDVSSRNRARHNFDDIVLETRGEAEEVLSHLVDLTIDYGQASVSDLYDLVGITGAFTDNKYGWYDLKDASVSRARDGYLLNLPRTILLD